MDKVSPFSLKRPQRPVKTVTLEDPLQPGAVLHLQLRAMDAIDFHKSEELAMAGKVKYLSRDAEPFPILQGDLIEVTASLIDSAASLCCMQVGPEENRYSLEEWIAIAATMPNVWQSLGGVSDVLTREGPLGKSLGVPTTDLSDSQSGTPSSTPNPSSDPTPSSGPSTKDLARSLDSLEVVTSADT